MNKQQMKEIIYEEFVNDIYENSKFTLSEDQNKMVEELMGQIFKEADLSAEERVAAAKKVWAKSNAGTSGAKKKPTDLHQFTADDGPRLTEPEIDALRKTDTDEKPTEKDTDTPKDPAAEDHPDGKTGDKEKPDTAPDEKAPPEAKQNAQEAGQQVAYVIQQADPKNFRQYMKRHGIIGGILKKGFEVLFGTGIWDDPADAQYILRGIYKNPYDAPMLMVQTLQQYRGQLMGMDPQIVQVAGQVVDAAKKEAANMDDDPAAMDAEATEDDRTGVPVPKPEEERAPDEVPPEEAPPGEEGEEKVVKDDIPVDVPDSMKAKWDKLQTLHLTELSPGEKRIRQAQQALVPVLIDDETAIMEGVLDRLPGSAANKMRKAVAASEDEAKQEKENERLEHRLLSKQLQDKLEAANLGSMKDDGLFGVALGHAAQLKPKLLQVIFNQWGPEFFARAMVHFRNTRPLETIIGGRLSRVFKDYLERERESLKNKEPEEGEEETLVTMQEDNFEEGQAAMKNQAIKKGKALLNWALKKLAKKNKKQMQVKKEMLTKENIMKAVNQWGSKKGVKLQEAKANKITEALLKVLR